MQIWIINLYKIKFLEIIYIFIVFKADTGWLIEYIKVKENNIEGTRQNNSVTSGKRVL